MYKEPVVDKVEGTEQQGRTFIRTIVGVVVGSLCLIVATGIWSNHYGDFGKVGTFLTYNDRIAKSEYLLRQEPVDRAKAWILGSSAMLSFLPETVEHKFDQKTFNLGVFWGASAEFQAWMNFLLEDLNTEPEMLLIGIETWTFAEQNDGPLFFRSYRRRLLNAPMLTPYLEDYGIIKHWVSRIVDLTTTQSMRYTVGALSGARKRKRMKPLEESKFALDGSNRVYSERQAKPFLPEHVNAFYEEIRVGRLDPESAEAYRRRDALMDEEHYDAFQVRAFLPGDTLSESKLAQFERTVSLADERGIPMAFVMLPTHPLFYDHLTRLTRHEAHLDSIEAFLLGLQEKYPSVKVVANVSRIERFGGSPYAFHDHHHMTPDNTDKILDLVHAHWNARP